MFLVWIILKVFIGFLRILLLFYGFVLFFFLAVWGMWDVGCMTRAQTRTSCTGRWSLDDWAAREVPDPVFKSPRTLCLAPLLKKTPMPSFYWGNYYVKLLLLFCEALGLAHQPWELCCSWQYVLLYKGDLTWTPDWSEHIEPLTHPQVVILLAIRLTSGPVWRSHLGLVPIFVTFGFEISCPLKHSLFDNQALTVVTAQATLW